MKYVSYFFAWVATVGAVSFYYKFFWDIFYHTYYQDMEAMLYGFTPRGMSEFNWKINFLIWLSGIILAAVVLWLIIDGVCKSHFKSRKPFPLTAFFVCQGAAVGVYVLGGVFSEYYERLYYMPRFLCDILGEVLLSGSMQLGAPPYLFISCIFHGVAFGAMGSYFYLKEHKRQMKILSLEEEHRREMGNLS